jgi:hypothetical protein
MALRICFICERADTLGERVRLLSEFCVCGRKLESHVLDAAVTLLI